MHYGCKKYFMFLMSHVVFHSSCSYYHWTSYTTSLPGFGCNIFFRFVKRITKPISVFLEDEGSEASSERHDQRILVFGLTDQLIHQAHRNKANQRYSKLTPGLRNKVQGPSPLQLKPLVLRQLSKQSRMWARMKYSWIVMAFRETFWRWETTKISWLLTNNERSVSPINQ